MSAPPRSSNSCPRTLRSRAGDSLRFRYAQLLEDGRTATGRCESRIEELADGRLRLHETWAWDSQPGSGTSVVEEIL